MNIKNFNIKLFGCKNNHENNNLLFCDYYDSQNINQSKIICDMCQKLKSQTYNNNFFKCLTCSKNLCPLCNLSHNNSHKIINYDKKNFVCNLHGELFIFYCGTCKLDLCFQCQFNHQNHKLLSYQDILPNEYEIRESLNNFRNKINQCTKKIKNLVQKLNEVSEKLELYYQINFDLFNNYKIENRNYYIISNLKDIKNNINNIDIDNLANSLTFNDSIKYSFNINSKINKINIREDENLKENEVKIKLNGNKVDNNILICNKYINISELKKLILSKNPKLVPNFLLIFCGKELEDNMRLNDFNIKIFKREEFYIEYESQIINYFENQCYQFKKIKIIYNEREDIFYAKSIFELKNYIYIYYNIPINNFGLYLNGNDDLIRFNDPSNISIKFIKLENITNFQKIKIFIQYNDIRWELLIGRVSKPNDLLYYLQEQYNFKYDPINETPIFRFENKRIQSLADSNIVNGDVINLELVSSYESIKREIDYYSTFQIFCKTLTKKTITLKVYPKLSILKLKILIENQEKIPFEEQRLIYQGCQLEDNKEIYDYNILDLTTLQLCLRLRGGMEKDNFII